MKLNDLFIIELANIHHAEQQLLNALTKISENSASDRLSNLLDQYSSDIEQHIERIVASFQTIEIQPPTRKCEAMEALISETKEFMNEFIHTPQLDAAIILSMQHIAHYKIASYDSLCRWSKLLKFDKITDLLEQNLLEENDTSNTLTDLAENEINLEAFSEANRSAK